MTIRRPLALAALLAAPHAAASDGAWLRVGVGLAGSMYTFEQRPEADPSPLLAETFAIRGPVGGKAAWPVGGEANARFFVPGFPYVGVRAQFRQTFFGVTADVLDGEVLRHALQVIDGAVVARVPIQVGDAVLHAGGRGGAMIEDFLYVLAGDASAGVRTGTLRVLRPTVGGEVGLEAGAVWVVAGATARPFNPARTATGLTVDLSGSYEIIPKFTVDVGFAYVMRAAPIVFGDTGRVHGHLSDDQLVARVGVGLALGSQRDVSAEPPRLLLRVVHDGAAEGGVPIVVRGSGRTWEIRSDGRSVPLEVPPGTYDITARSAGRDATQQVELTRRDVDVVLELKPRGTGRLSASFRHFEDAPLDGVTLLLRGEDGYVATETLGPWGLSDLDVPAGRYHLFLWSLDGAVHNEPIEVVARKPLHVDAELRPPAARVDDTRVKFDGRIDFEDGGVALLPEAAQALGDVATLLHVTPTLARVEIQSHTDGEGDAAANIVLTQKRAELVREHLIALGIAPSRLTAVGYGPRFPTATNSTPEGREANRRVEFLVLEADDL